MPADVLAALGAFASGVGSILGGLWALRTVRRRAERKCDERLAELRDAFERGVEQGLGLERREPTD